ncbi:hypothetical protein DSM14862_04466 (plasmid) [Sulfitobacter indolifex]|uniref:hypothetical protein n=1 Tax=Sulfitobacter indolifex TaxID=225422 RepID=UPI001FAC9A9C|nr:hypothetical protein [Sulfitobacter indolifex]UOA21626.1 hypothetical protein DSM14862_04466 [Sulfitobacter indolifex]
MKRIIFTHGDKGGVGKTQVATRTAAAFAAKNQSLQLVDGDAKNPGLYQSWHSSEHPVHRCNVLKIEGIEDLFEAIASADGDVLIDMPAGGSAATERFTGGGSEEGSIDLGMLLGEIDARAVVLFAVDQNREPIAALRDELQVFPVEHTDWIIVRNHYEDRPFTDFDASKTREAVLERGGKIIDMTRLDPAVTSLMSREGLNLISIQDSDKASMINKIRAKAALAGWIGQLKLAGVLDE